MPVVGGAALFAYVIAANHSYLSPQTIRELLAKGWGITNHSYSHIGRSWGNPPEILTSEQIREELYWSQSIFAHDYGEGRAPTHFVYPNGYTGYAQLFGEFGLLSASHVGGPGGCNMLDEKTVLTSMPRAYLDEGPWSGKNNDTPLHQFPKDGPQPGHLQIDFTHGNNPDPESANQKRWKARMDHISARYGKDGDDTMWSAPVQSVIHYTLARRKASVAVKDGVLKVTLPDDAPGSPLTIRLEGIPEATQMPAPQGGALLYRKGTTVWITTPFLGKPGTAAPEPRIRRDFTGPAGTHEFASPVQMAGVQLYHIGKPEAETEVRILLTLADGTTQTLGPKILKAAWGNGNLLFPVLPHRAPLSVKKIEVSSARELKRMDVWVVGAADKPVAAK